MTSKVSCVFLAQAILIQVAFSQYMSRTAPAIATPCSASIAASTLSSPFFETSYLQKYPALASSAIEVEVTPTSGGLLPVTSASAFSPELKLASDNEYEGTLSVAGELPFIGTVGLKGTVPSAGMGIVNHACGNGPARITNMPFGRLSNSGIIPEVYSSGFDYRNAMKYGTASQFGHFGFGENAYGGIGEGNVAVAGQIPVAGDAAIAGQVPIMGTVNYCGAVPASGGNVLSQCAGSYGTEVTNNAAFGYGSGPAAIPSGAISSNLGRGSSGFGFTSGFGGQGSFSNAGSLGYDATSGAAYGGNGEGNVIVVGELPIAGSTSVVGHVPIMGSVSFSGNVPAAGSVIISGRCTCGCDNH
ncbi:unnamed protein product [Arctia plantaginis]|uniref:Uncharacterized protein n=1 Tax=Arctia plantaginis TaxID=874455 RepID=A0A8S1A5P4_ARCPL|nr:unnamed protein product [Arctia plantaginis]